jgi:hypothetical protein
VLILTDKRTGKETHFVDIKSDILRDGLKSLLEGVKATMLDEDEPTVKPPQPKHEISNA